MRWRSLRRERRRGWENPCPGGHWRTFRGPESEKTRQNGWSMLWIVVPSRRVGLVEGESFGFSGEEEELWEVASSRLSLAGFYARHSHSGEETRTIHGEIRTASRMVKYITPQELKVLIKSETNDYLVVDVRDDDYRGGNIKGGINIPSEKFLLKLHQLIDDTQDVSKIIFHCALSQQR